MYAYERVRIEKGGMLQGGQTESIDGDVGYRRSPFKGAGSGADILRRPPVRSATI